MAASKSQAEEAIDKKWIILSLEKTEIYRRFSSVVQSPDYLKQERQLLMKALASH